MTTTDAIAAPDQLTAPDDATAADEQFASDERLFAIIDRLTAILDGSDLAELEVEAGGTGLVLRKAEAFMQPAAVAPSPAAPGTAEAGHQPSVAPADVASVAPAHAPTTAAPAAPAGPAPMTVVAPLTGIFYASPTPTAPAFVSVGQEIVVGQVIGLIEAMKLFNEIKSDKAGRVARLVAENGALVKAKQPLIEVEVP